MGALTGFLPFLAFALGEKLLGVMPGLLCGALASAALLWRQRGAGEVDVLEAGGAVMFTALALLGLARPDAVGSLWLVRLWVDVGLLLVILGGLALRRPFTLRHARRHVTPEVARMPRFLRTNQLLSAAWAGAFAVLVAADLLMVARPDAPAIVAIGLSIAALAAAAGFTRWFAGRVRGE